MAYPQSVMGGQLKVAFPTSIEALLRQGASFLTDAFHASGVMPSDNAVAEIVQAKEFFGGGMGRKLLLSLRYRHPDPDLHRDLFVKFPRDFGDPLRDLFAPLMEPEVRFALLSRRPDFPIAVPKCYFADYEAATTSGILIAARIKYGEGDIEPCLPKCSDHEMADPVGHYRALTRAVARLAGFYKGGKFGRDTESQFPFDPVRPDTGSRIPYDRTQLQTKLEKLRSFVCAHPQLFPDALVSEQFLAHFVADAPLVLEHETAIKAYLNSDLDYISLCHWNANVDNAWFSRDRDGELSAGLLDWGSVGQMNIAQAIYGITCAAEIDFLNEHRRVLLEVFIEEYRSHGGASIPAEDLAHQYKLAVAVLGIAWIVDAPSLIEREIHDVRGLTGRFDPNIRDVFLAKAQLQLLTVLLNEWQNLDIGAAVRDFRQSMQRRA